MTTGKAEQRAERILSFEEARQCVAEHASPLRNQQRAREEVALLDSLGRTLAEDLVADRDFPPFARAARDGYALRSADIRYTPAELEMVGKVRAGGDLPAGFVELGTGQAISITTGAPVPPGADAVVMVEHTEGQARHVRVLKSISTGDNIVPRGSEALANSVLAKRGTVLSSAYVALAAAIGKPAVHVYARPQIAILSTGDEVVPISDKPKDNQIRNSNAFSLAAQVISAGGEPVQLPIAPDEPQRLRELITQGLEHDLLLLSGGVSAGEYDFVEDVLSDFSAEILFTGVQIQPGKPLVFGRVPRKIARAQDGLGDQWTYFFGLPGNPISTMVTFELFAGPMVRALAGSSSSLLQAAMARLTQPINVKAGLTRFLPARLSGEWMKPEVSRVKWQGSGDIAAFARADCLLVIPPDRELFEAGEMMTVIPIA